MQASNDSNIIKLFVTVEAYDEGSVLVNIIVPLLFALRTTTTITA
jgi:hypothetical protein